jgi:hypothetical protein
MNSFLKNLMVVVGIVALTSLTIMATEAGKLKKNFTFPSDISVKGTPIKAGTYKIEFDDQSGELSIMKGSKLVAKTQARWEKRDAKAKQTSITTATGGKELLSITFGGEDQNLVVATGD